MIANEFVPTPVSTFGYLRQAGLIGPHGLAAKQGLRLYGTPLGVRAPEVLRNTGRAAVVVRATHYTGEIEAQLRALAPEVELW